MVVTSLAGAVMVGPPISFRSIIESYCTMFEPTEYSHNAL